MASDEAFRSIFSSNLRRLLQEKDTTQKALADFMGVSTATISDWKNGKVTPRLDKIDKLCAFFHIDRVELTGDHFGKQYGDEGFIQFAQETKTSRPGNEETALINAYRYAPAEIRRIIDFALQPYRRVADKVVEEKKNDIAELASKIDVIMNTLKPYQDNEHKRKAAKLIIHNKESKEEANLAEKYETAYKFFDKIGIYYEPCTYNHKGEEGNFICFSNECCIDSEFNTIPDNGRILSIDTLYKEISLIEKAPNNIKERLTKSFLNKYLPS